MADPLQYTQTLAVDGITRIQNEYSGGEDSAVVKKHPLKKWYQSYGHAPANHHHDEIRKE